MHEKRILRIEDLLELIPVSRATFDRWIREARQGISDFPLPFTQPGRRCLWDSHVIEEWIANRHRAPAMIRLVSYYRRTYTGGI